MKNKFIKLQTSRAVAALFLLTSAVAVSAQNINTPNKVGPMGLEVNTSSGNLFVPRTDIYIPSQRFNLIISFYYNSYLFNENNGFGNGWNFRYNVRYKTDTTGAKTIQWGDGREDRYLSLGAGKYKTPAGFFNNLLEYEAGKWLLTERSGLKYFFDDATHRKVTRMEEPNGNFISFTYSDSSLKSLTNDAGQSISFSYNNGLLATVTDAITSPARTYTYTYDAVGNLIKVIDPLKGEVKYAYVINGPLKSVTDKNNNVVDIVYHDNYGISELIGCNKRLSFSYDTTTLTSYVTDYIAEGSNQVTRYEYQKHDNRVWLTKLSGNCCGFNMQFEFDGQGNKTKETDANGNATTYTYDNRGNVLSITDALNQAVYYTYSADYNKITSYTDSKGLITTLAYDAKGNLLKITEPGNVSFTATYNAKGDVVSSTDPKGNVFTYTYDAFGNPVSASGPGGFQATLAFNERGDLLSFTDARGSKSQLEYDILGRLKKITDPLSNRVQFNYDAEGNIVSFKNENNEESTIGYDASNRMVKLTDAKGAKTLISYTETDKIKSMTDANGNSRHLTYDSRNRVSKLSDALNNDTHFSYDGNGNVQSLILSNGQVLSYTYDKLDRITNIKDSHGTIASITYDKNSNVISYINGTGAVTTVEYDDLNRFNKMTDALGNTTTLTYDKNNNITFITDRNNNTKSFTYDNLNRVISTTDNNGFTVTATRDAEGNIIAIKDQNNNSTHYTYDALDRITKTTYANGTYVQYTYDVKGNVTSKRLADGTTINYQYDSLNRMISRTLPDGNVFIYTFDAGGRVISATNNAGTITFTYDALNRIKTETFDGRTIAYTYNTAGRTETIQYPDSTLVTRSFDTRNRLIKISKNNTDVVEYEYNQADQVIRKKFGNGLSTSYQYDFANRFNNFSTANGAIQNSAFTYDKEMNKVSVSRLNNPSQSEQFSYDRGYRLTGYKKGTFSGPPVYENTYSYDAVGNRISASINGVNTSYSINNLNQITGKNSNAQNISLLYDNNGNLTFDGSFYKFYDAEGKLLKDSSSPFNILLYKYDAMGRRVQKSVNGAISKFTYSGYSPIEERDGNTNTVVNRKVFHNFITPVLNEQNNNSFYYHQNELNSVEAISNSAGNLTEKYQYDVYGKPTIYDAGNNLLSASPSGNQYAFTGQQYNSITGDYLFHFRNYSPDLGIFLQRDLIGTADQMGLYQYTGNNPATYLDPLGLAPCPPKDIVLDIPYSELSSRFGNLLTFLSLLKSLEKSEKFAGLNKRTQVVNLTISIQDFLNKSSSMDEKTKQIALANIETAAMGLVGDLLPDNAYTAPYKTVVGAYGKLDAATQEITYYLSDGQVSMSLAEIYARQSDAPEQLGRDIAQNFNEGYRRRQEKLDQYMKEHGNDIETWEMKYKLMYKLNRSIDKNSIQKTKRVTIPVPPSNDCPPNNNPGGTQKPKPGGTGTPGGGPGTGGSTEVISALDPNEIIGPQGVAEPKWVSVNERLPYTILYENHRSATAPAKSVRITYPLPAKHDPGTFQLGTFGFNNLTFSVPNASASYYQRLDARDSLGLYVDVTAGYDQLSNQAFWQFQSIDPLTLLPPSDPLKGFLLLQDTGKATSGHGFVNFSIKPVQSSNTGDTIGAKASILFDLNDTIPTNVAKNTIDAVPPSSRLNDMPATTNHKTFTLTWSGADEVKGSGLKSYTLYMSVNDGGYVVYRSNLKRTDTTFTGEPNNTYKFFVLATDSAGNTETLRPGVEKTIFISGAALPVTWLHFAATLHNKDGILNWGTGMEVNSKEFEIDRSTDGSNYTTIGTVASAGNSTRPVSYQYRDRNITSLKASVVHYRLRQIDKDGNYTYSNIASLQLPGTDNVPVVRAYPNPFNQTLNVMIANVAVGKDDLVSVYTLEGKLIYQRKIGERDMSATVTLNDLPTLPAGTYLLNLVLNKQKFSYKIIKQK